MKAEMSSAVTLDRTKDINKNNMDSEGNYIYYTQT
jgi:hypothetical protein